MKIAVLLPSSTTHKQLGYDFYLALQYALAYKQIPVEWMSASIGFGVDEADMLSKAEDLLLNRGADLLVAFADYPKISHLFPLLEATNKELLLVNMGSRLPENWQPHPSVFHLNLQESLLAHLGGKTLYHEGTVTAALASNYYEGGYIPCQLIIDAFMQEGGDISYNFIPQSKAANLSIEPLVSYIRSAMDVPTVIASYSDPLTTLFLTQWKESTIAHTKLWGSSTLLMDTLASDPSLLMANTAVSGILAWYRELDTPENQNFVRVFEQKLNRKASYIAALGWDTGLLLARGMSSEAEQGPIRLKDILDDPNATLELTRGKALMDTAFNTVVAPAYRLYVEDKQLCYEVIEAKNTLIEWQDLKLAHQTPNQNGWLNTYLCS